MYFDYFGLFVSRLLLTNTNKMDINTFYVIIVGVLVVLAISDLVVGVSNDAVNFLNSALGSKAFNFKVIMAIAALGILVGATFSSGMMEVARKGIFHPQNFYFSEIILLFLAVMITDILLLDLFNTFGMPTSTTVSIVFELLGSAVAMSVIKIINDPNHLPLDQYINSGKALTIILGILLSVVIAFTSGAIIQYFSRLLFSFDYKKNLKYYGAVWGGLAIASITYFILVKGAKSASFMDDDLKHMIKDNGFMIILASFAVWAILFQIIIMFTRFNVLKIVVLIGTFALAMAFSGNDLVNFIGVPLAGFESYTAWAASSLPADSFLMSGLAGKVATPTYLLLGAGIIMAVTLYFSKKARSVTETEINLARQDEGQERFGSSAVSRSIVRTFTKTSSFVESILPVSLKNKLEKRFDQTVFQEEQKTLGDKAPAFDLVRASVILSTASIIISIATFLKLPLSTTYVTFMVAMGASLSDGAWGRETAVYRITGVFSVIGGWFFTAIVAFIASFTLAFIFYYGGMYVIIIVLFIVAYVLYRTHVLHKEIEKEKEEKSSNELLSSYNKVEIIDYNSKNIQYTLHEITEILNATIKALSHENLSLLKDNYKRIKKLNYKAEQLQNQINKMIGMTVSNDIECGNYYAVSIYYLRELVDSVNSIVERSYNHCDNNHKPLLLEQINELKDVMKNIDESLSGFSKSVKEQTTVHDYISKDKLVDELRKLRKNQVKRVKSKTVGTRNSILYLSIIDHFRSIVNFSDRLESIHRNFIEGSGDKVD